MVFSMHSVVDILIDMVYKTFMVTFGGREFNVYLLLLDMNNFWCYSGIGMNKLAMHHDSMNSFTKEVMFQSSREVEFRFYGKWNSNTTLIFTIKPKKYLQWFA